MRRKAVRARGHGGAELYFGEAFDNALAFISGEPVSILNPEALQRRPREKG